MVTKTKTKTVPPKTLVLLDAHAILHRAYHALPEFVSAAGEPTGGLYGLTAMLLKIIAQLKPDALVAAYDLPEPTFRKQLYDDYKAGRAKADEALVAQMIRSRDVFAGFGIPIYEAPGFEADDIIGTIVERFKSRRDWRVIIASGDMDTLQLVDDKRGLVYTLKKGINDTILYDEVAVRARFGFGPELLPDYKGLAGDPSDNIIGIKGIGEKTATELIKNFGAIEQIYKKLKKDKTGEAFAAAGIKPRVVDLLREGEEEALFSKTLATIRRDAPIKFEVPADADAGDWRTRVKTAELETLFATLGFRTSGPRLRAALEGGGEIAASGAVSAELGIALWLLNSDLTNPTAEDLKRAGGREKVLAELKKQNLTRVYEQIELPLIPIIAVAERRGILVDRERLAKLSAEYHRELATLAKRIFAAVGGEFNLNSPKQLAEILFDKLALSVKGLKKTAGGARSTRESELLKLAPLHPAVSLILEHRELQKLLSTYLDNLPPLLDAAGRLHTHLNQAGTTTGRFSSSEPNLQNIPAGGGRGAELRRAFIASPGHLWAAFDYSQVEMRVLALLSGDEGLQKIFQGGEDVHRSVAARVFGVAENEVTKEQRRRAKVINFGIIYGMGVNALRQNLGSSREEAQKFYEQYFVSFPKIRAYFDTVIAEAKKRGYTETYFGRRRALPGLRSPLPFVKAMNERMAMNAPLQGTAADIVKLAMSAVDKLLTERGARERAHLLLQVHDELIYEIENDLAAELVPLIKTTMENVVSAQIPFPVHAATGQNWAEV